MFFVVICGLFSFKKIPKMNTVTICPDIGLIYNFHNWTGFIYRDFLRRLKYFSYTFLFSLSVSFSNFQQQKITKRLYYFLLLYLSSLREALARAFHELERYHTRPFRLNWGPENVHFGKTHFWNPNINVRIFIILQNLKNYQAQLFYDLSFPLR